MRHDLDCPDCHGTGLHYRIRAGKLMPYRCLRKKNGSKVLLLPRMLWLDLIDKDRAIDTRGKNW